MNYFKNKDNEIFAYDDEQVAQGYGKDLEFLLSPIKEDGTIYLGHKALNELETKEDGSYYELYKQDGTPDLEAIQSEQVANELANRMNMTISPRQARLILLRYGLLDDIEDMLSTDRAMQVWWEYSLDIKRSNEHIINAGMALGLTDEELDNMFIEGSKL